VDGEGRWREGKGRSFSSFGTAHAHPARRAAPLSHDAQQGTKGGGQAHIGTQAHTRLMHGARSPPDVTLDHVSASCLIWYPWLLCMMCAMCYAVICDVNSCTIRK
jgi:hypothetical protein